MNVQMNEKKGKVSKSSGYSSLRIRKDIKRRVLSDLGRINKKDLGRKVHASDYFALLTSLLTEDHIYQLQESSLSNADRLEREYRKYISSHEFISKDEYLGKRLNGEVDEIAAKNS